MATFGNGKVSLGFVTHSKGRDDFLSFAAKLFLQFRSS